MSAVRTLVERLVRLATRHTGCVIALLLVSAVIVRYQNVQFAVGTSGGGGNLCAADYLLNAASPDSGFSVSWLLAPAASIACAWLLWRLDYCAERLVRHRTLRSVWMGHLVDSVAISLCVGIVESAFCVVSALSSSDELVNFSDSTSYFAERTGAVLASAPSFACVATAVSLLTVLATCASTIVFDALLGLTGSPVASALCVVVPAIPFVHASDSFVYDIVRNLLGGVLSENPLHALYSAASVTWGTWLPGASHNLGFLAACIVALSLLAWTVVPRRDVLSQRCG